MPLQIIPRRIFAHRVACKALYRACLVQLPRIPIPNDLPSTGQVPLLKHLLRKGFKKNINLTSPRLAVRELKRGYVAEELLRNAGNGNVPALNQIHSVLRRTLHEKQLSRLASPPRARPSTSHPHVPPAPYPGAPKVEDIRPLPASELSGRRRVPILTSCNWLPFLRFKRPQSPYLSRVLRDKLVQKTKRWDVLQQADDAIEIGEAEGLWEARVARQVRKEVAVAEEQGLMGEKEERMKRWLEEEGSEFGDSVERFFGPVLGEEKERRSLWATEAAKLKFELWGTVNEENERSLERGKRMLEIVGREKEMWARERQERRDVKRAAKGKGPGGRGGGNHGSGEDVTVKEDQGTVSYKPMFWEVASEKGNPGSGQ